MNPSAPPSTGGGAWLRAAIWAGRVAAAGSRIANRGSGDSIRGLVISTLDPGALGKLLVAKRVVVVSGTNGKTTTTHFLAAAVRAGLDPTGRRVVHNADGANLHRGIVAALSKHREADVAVLETDERVVADMVRLGRPELLVLLNLSRDQLDRHHEPKLLARSWRDALEEAGAAGPVVVANAADPLIVWAALAAKRVVWVEAPGLWTGDFSWCPECGSKLIRERVDGGGASGLWRCPGCPLAQPPGDLLVAHGTITDRNGDVWEPRLGVPGEFNVGNAACALAAAVQLGVPTGVALEGMRQVASPAGRYATIRIAGVVVRLLLAKNPAGWGEALRLAQSPTVVLAIDSAAADGRDVSWLWDVDFDRLTGQQVVATGPRAQDLAVRLSHAHVPHTCIPDLADAFAGLQGPVDVVATYTPFQRLRKLGGL